MRERDSSIDVLRGFGILLVIAGHVFYDDWTQYIFSFHMPLFFFISGFCFARKPVHRLSFSYFKRKCLTLLLPYAVFFILSFCLNDLSFAPGQGLHLITETDARSLIKAFILSGGYLDTVPISNFPLWFLPHLFLADLLFCAGITLIEKLPNKRVQFVILLVIAILLCFSAKPLQALIPGRPLLHVNVFPSSLAFLCFGFLFAELRSLAEPGRFELLTPLLLLAGYLLQAVNGGGNVANVHSVLYFPAALLTVLGFYALATRFRSRILSFIGKHSIFYLGLHLWVFFRFCRFSLLDRIPLSTVRKLIQLALCVLIISVIAQICSFFKSRFRKRRSR